MVLTIPSKRGTIMELPTRKLPRLQQYDYSKQNYYYVTICTHEKSHLFGSFNNLNQFGKIAQAELLNIPTHFDGIKIDKYVVMPNHIHAIIIIGCNGEAERSRPFPTLSTVIGLYKSGVSKLIHEIEPQIPVWQKSFYDKIIRNEQGYQEVWQYINENSLKWQEDE